MDQYPGELVVFAAEFFNEKLSMYRVSLTDGTLVDSRIIDDSTILAAYSVALVDLNGDGKQQLLVNNHETKQKTNGIWAYSLPEDGDLMNGEFVKNTIATEFNVVFNLFVPQMSPGFPYAVWPHGKEDGERAHVFVAGDGDQSAHDLYPSEGEFGYTDDLIVNAKGTVGALAFTDLNNDGWTEMWMPNYDKSYVELFKFRAPTPADEKVTEAVDEEVYEIDFEIDLDLSELPEMIEGFIEGFMEQEEAFLQ